MKSSELINLGPRIRKERRSKGISQSDFSKNLCISASYLNLLENGRRTLTVPLLIKIGKSRINLPTNIPDFISKRNNITVGLQLT